MENLKEICPMSTRPCSYPTINSKQLELSNYHNTLWLITRWGTCALASIGFGSHFSPIDSHKILMSYLIFTQKQDAL
jgi:hypothetical protein